MATTLRGDQSRLETAAEGGADRRSAVRRGRADEINRAKRTIRRGRSSLGLQELS
jgi:hypothetical protein